MHRPSVAVVRTCPDFPHLRSAPTVHQVQPATRRLPRRRYARFVRELSRGPGRLARGAVFAVLAEALALAAHVSGGAPSPSPLVLLAIAVALVLASTAAAGRRRGPGSIGLGLLLTQWLLHQAFSVLAVQHPGSASAQVMPGMASMSHGSMSHGSMLPSLAGVPQQAMAGMGGMHLGGRMLLMHLVATALTGVLLVHGEAMLWRSIGWFRPRLPVLPTCQVAVRLPVPITSGATKHVRLAVGGLGRRGPPVAQLAS